MTVATPSACRRKCNCYLDHTEYPSGGGAGTYALPLGGSGNGDAIADRLPDDFFDVLADDVANELSDEAFCVTSDEAGESQMPVEKVSLDTATYEAEIWTSIEIESITSDAPYTLWYGTAGGELTQPAVDASYGRNAVWTDYAGVWHFEDSSGLFATNAVNGASAAVSGASSDVGIIGTSASFRGAGYSDNIKPADIALTGQMTIQYFAKRADVYTVNFIGVMREGQYLLNVNGSHYPLFARWSSQNLLSSNLFPANQWGMLSATWNGSALLYVNGQLDCSVNDSGSSGVASNDLYFGYGPSYSDQRFQGLMDEIRIVSSARSADYIATDYAIQSSTSLVTVGTPEDVGGGGGTFKPGWAMRRQRFIGGGVI